jgi:hypothetical protein
VIGCGIDQMLLTIEGEALKYSPDRLTPTGTLAA